MPYRLFVIILCLIVLGGCAAKSEPDSDLFPEMIVEEGLQEPLDKELTEDWPDVGDATLTESERVVLETKLDFPYPLNDASAQAIQKQFLFLVRQVPRTVRNWLMRSAPYLSYVEEEVQQAGLPRELAYLPFIESGFNTRAYSRAGAAGMWQFMVATGRNYGLRRDMWIDERRDPYKSTQAAAAYLTKLKSLLGEWTLAVASYNAGEAKIMKAVEATGSKDFFELAQRNHTLPHSMQLRKETLEFVPRFLAMAKIVSRLESLGFDRPGNDDALKVARIEIGPRVNLKALATTCGLSWEEFRNYNPAFRRSATPPQGKFWASVPLGKKQAALEYLSKPQPKPDYDGLTTYVVKRGDTWSRIAHRAGVSVALIKEANNTRSDMLRPGQRVYVPIPGGGEEEGYPSERTTTPIKSGTYVVKRGDTLSHIANRTGVPVKKLMAVNDLSSAKSLRAGQKITIPGRHSSAGTRSRNESAPTTYRVKQGDTIWMVARRFNVSPSDLLRWNSLHKRSIIRPGDVIKVYK